LLAKSRFYKYHLEREQEDAASNGVIKRINGKSKYKLISKRNSRNVWQFPPSNSHGEHTAAFPMELPMRCLRLSTEPGDLVFDPFTGSGTTLAAANLLGCHYFGCDIIKEYVADAKRRLKAPDKALMKNKKGVTQLNSLKLPFNEG
jgi:DNA modification methylase